MVLAETRLHTNEGEVTATVIDGEAIMINLTSGVYYSTDGVGARVWELAAAGATVAETAALIAREYDVPAAQASADTEKLVNQFIEEKLLIPHTYTSSPAPSAAEPSATPYQAPNLEIYREMGHLLALDPPMPGLENIAWDDSQPA